MTPAVRSRLQEEIERTLSSEEASAYLATPIDDAERAEILELMKWFRRRYPTPLERLQYVTRAYKRWTRMRGGQP